MNPTKTNILYEIISIICLISSYHLLVFKILSKSVGLFLRNWEKHPKIQTFMYVMILLIIEPSNYLRINDPKL